MEKHERHHLNQVAKVNIICDETNQHHVPFDIKEYTTSVSFLPKIHDLTIIIGNIGKRQIEGPPEKITGPYFQKT